MNKTKILLTGGAGYIGLVLTRYLINKGFYVRILDNFFYGTSSIKNISTNPFLEIVNGDIKNTKTVSDALTDVNQVVHLAALVGDPLCSARAQEAVATNYLATRQLAKLCKKARIKNFIFSSSCSVYGYQRFKIVDEKTPVNPLSFYAETKIKAEQELLALSGKNFPVTILRLATAYGWSPRMRFDLVINALTKQAQKTGRIIIFGGNQWRPFIHVKDIARGIYLVLTAPTDKIQNQIFNVGTTRDNYQIKKISRLIKKVMPSVKVEIVKNISDQRSYRVSFEKFRRQAGFESCFSVIDGIKEIKSALENGLITDPDNPVYYNDRLSSIPDRFPSIPDC